MKTESQEVVSETQKYLDNYRDKICRKLCKNYRTNKQSKVRSTKHHHMEDETIGVHHVPGEMTNKEGCDQWYLLPGEPYGKSGIPFCGQFNVSAECPNYVRKERVA